MRTLWNNTDGWVGALSDTTYETTTVLEHQDYDGQDMTLSQLHDWLEARKAEGLSVFIEAYADDPEVQT